MERSLLPRIVALKHKYNIDLFAVALPIYPQIDEGCSYDQKKRHYSRLGNYLEGNGIKFISFWDYQELNNPRG